MEESLPELIINLTTDHWVLLPSILVSKKIKKISIFKICGELFGDVTQMQQLKPKDMIKIIEEAHRFNCDIFVFDRVDFKLFKSKPFADLEHPLCFPVTGILFESCNNIEGIFPQIFNLSPDNYEQGIKSITFQGCYGTTLNFRNESVELLKMNYKIRTIQYLEDRLTVYVSRAKEYNDVNRDTNKLLRRNIVGKLVHFKTLLVLLGIRRFRKETLLHSQPKEIIRIIAKMLLTRKEEYCHNLGITGRLETFDTEKIFDDNLQPKGHQKLLKITFNESDRNCLDQLKELRRKRFTLDKLVVEGTNPRPNKEINLIAFEFIPNLFNKIIDTRTKILEIHNMTFNEDTIMRELAEQGEHLNGDDSKIEGLASLNSPDIPLTEVTIIKCRQVFNFLKFLFKILNKRHRFTFEGLSLGYFGANYQENVLVRVDRKNNIITTRIKLNDR